MSTPPPVYATKISISNFRGYGHKFEIPLAPGPCVVLLSGPNGLGKTSLFEAIEWALTGGVRRLDRLATGGAVDPKDLARQAKGVESFEVSLDFRDATGQESRVRRTQVIASKAKQPETVGTPQTEIVNLLSHRDGWGITENNFGDYLHLTHLHAQVAVLRFIAFTGKERWVKVSPLAGAERFERLRTNLTNAKKPLTQIGTDLERKLADAHSRMTRWQELLTRRRTAESLAAAAQDALSPTEIIGGIRRLRAGIPGLERPHVPTGEITVDAAADAIRAFREELATARSVLGRRIEDLGSLRPFVKRFMHYDAEARRISESVAALDQRIADSREELRVLAATTASARAERDTRANLREAAAKKQEAALLAVRDAQELEALHAEIAEIRQSIAQKDIELTQAHAQKQRCLEAIEQLNALERRRVELGARVKSITDALDCFREIDALEKQLAVERLKVAEYTSGVMRADRENVVLHAALKDLDEKIEDTQRNLESLRRSAQGLEQALGVILGRISHSDTTCPVCTSHFEPGVLQSLVRGRHKALDPRIEAAESGLEQMRGERARLVSKIETAALERRRFLADEAAGKQAVLEIETRLTNLLNNGILKEAGPVDTRQRVEKFLLIARSELELTTASERAMGAASGLEAQRDTAERDIGHKQQILAAEQSRLLLRESRSAEAQARLSRFKSDTGMVVLEVDALKPYAQARAEDTARARDVAERAALACAHAEQQEATALQAVTTLNLQRATENDQRLNAVAESSSIGQRWRTAELPEPISETVLDEAQAAATRQRLDVDKASTELGTLSSAIQRWQHGAELNAVIADVQRESAGRDAASYTALLENEIAEAQASAAAAKHARAAADELSDRLNKVGFEFGERSVEPFGIFFQRYLTALIHDERFHDIAVTYAAAARAASLRFVVGLGGESSKTDAEFILSEGQLGEVSLAAMLAASSAFPWSRWNALMLDDPAQYNDLIHATALYDVLRNLVAFRNCQIILSTHDTEQADFFRRKLDAIQVPWVDCRFLGHTEQGIDVAVVSNLDRSATTPPTPSDNVIV